MTMKSTCLSYMNVSFNQILMFVFVEGVKIGGTTYISLPQKKHNIGLHNEFAYYENYLALC